MVGNWKRLQGLILFTWEEPPQEAPRASMIATRRDFTTWRGAWRAARKWILFISACFALAPRSEYPQYNKGRGYYAVFFADPDGLKLECVYTPPLGG
jgi:hypothetical protein